MFLRKLAFAVGRLDFWNLPNELTQFQLAVHRAAMDLESTGEDRADMRTALLAIVVAQSNLGKAMTEKQIEDVWNALTKYTPIHSMQEAQQMTPDEAALMGKAAFARIGK